MKSTIAIFIFGLILISFQNCSKIQATKANGGLELMSTSTNNLLLETDFETPVEFHLAQKKAGTGFAFNFVKATSSNLKGSFQVLDADALKLVFIPGQGFRGVEKALVTVTDLNRDKLTFSVTVRVGNPLSSIEPALAVRAVGCVLCHANIKSNIITDFGFDNDYFFGGTGATALPWDSFSIYGSYRENMRSMSLAAGKSVVVPDVDLPMPMGRLTSYVESELAFANPNTSVIAKKSVFIGAPTEKDLTDAFHLGSERIKFYKNDDDESPSLTGLIDSGNFFQAIGEINCDGDVIVRGPLYLKDLRINTINGCRLYVIGSVFLFGEITYLNSANTTSNLQITSTRSINLGLGSIYKDDKLCDATAQPRTKKSKSTLQSRYVDEGTSVGFFVRGTESPKVFGNSVLAESRLIEAQLGLLYDGSCLPEGRTVHYERILLNAPAVHSRYTGNFSGTVIAEVSMMALNQFKFEFDNVFKEVPILPLLDPAKYLKISNE